MLGKFILLGSGMFVWQAVQFRVYVLCINLNSRNRRVSLLRWCDPALLNMLSTALLPYSSFLHLISNFLWHGSRIKFMYASNNTKLFRTLFTELPKRDICLNFTWGSEKMRELYFKMLIGEPELLRLMYPGCSSDQSKSWHG